MGKNNYLITIIYIYITIFQFFKYITAYEHITNSLTDKVWDKDMDNRTYFHPNNGVFAMRSNSTMFRFYLHNQCEYELRTLLKKSNINYNRAIMVSVRKT